MADLLPISERLYDLSILLVFRFDDTYEHDVLLNHHIPVEEDKALPPTDTSAQALRWIAASTWVCLAPSLLQQANTGLQLSLELGEELDLEIDPVSPEFRCRLGGKRQLFVLLQLRQVPACAIQLLSIG